MQITINGEKIDNFESFMKYRDTIRFIMIPGIALIGLGIILIQIYNVYHMISYDWMPFVIGIIVILISIQSLILVNHASNRKVVNEDYQKMDIKYKELYEFLSQCPINQRKENLEYIGYAIAFGLNSAFDKDFGIESEPKIKY